MMKHFIKKMGKEDKQKMMKEFMNSMTEEERTEMMQLMMPIMMKDMKPRTMMQTMEEIMSDMNETDCKKMMQHMTREMREKCRKVMTQCLKLIQETQQTQKQKWSTYTRQRRLILKRNQLGIITCSKRKLITSEIPDPPATFRVCHLLMTLGAVGHQHPHSSLRGQVQRQQLKPT